MELSRLERDSALWGRIEKHLKDRIDLHRRKNDNDMDPVETATLRGRIAEAKALLALADEKPEFVGQIKPKVNIGY